MSSDATKLVLYENYGDSWCIVDMRRDGGNERARIDAFFNMTVEDCIYQSSTFINIRKCHLPVSLAEAAVDSPWWVDRRLGYRREHLTDVERRQRDHPMPARLISPRARGRRGSFSAAPMITTAIGGASSTCGATGATKAPGSTVAK